MINLTNNAIKKLQEFVTPEEVIRIGVEGGGCAGFQYKFGLVPIADTFPDDTVIEEDDGLDVWGDEFDDSEEEEDY